MNSIILPDYMNIEEYRNILYEHYIKELSNIGINTDSIYGLRDNMYNWVRQDKSNPRMVHLNLLEPNTYGFHETVCIIVVITGLRVDGFDMGILYKKIRNSFLPYG